MKFLGSILYGLPKRRKISAIRDFPLECGPNAVKGSIEESSDLVSPSFIKDVGSGCKSPTAELTIDGCTHSRDSHTDVTPTVNFSTAKENPPTEKCTDKEQTSLAEDHPQCQPLGDEKCEAFWSVLYGPAKRRKLSAIRDFPLGFGTANHGKISTNEFFTDALLSREKSLVETKPMKLLVKHHAITESVSTSGDLLERSECNNVVEVSTEPQAESNLQEHSLEEVAVKLDSETELCTNTVRLTQETDNENEDYIFSNYHNQWCTSQDEHSSQVTLLSGKGKVRKYVQENGDISVSKSGLREKAVKEEDLEIVSAMVPSGSKLGIIGKKRIAAKKSIARQTHKSLKASIADTDASILRKSMNAKNIENSSIQKMRYSLDSPDKSNKQKSLSLQKEEDIVLETHGDRVIVQALMAASNCPWMCGKRSGTGSFSGFPVGRERKEKKVSHRRKSSSIKMSSKFEDSTAAEDHHLLLTLYAGNEGAPSSPYGSRELSVMLLPSMRTDSNDDSGRDGHQIAIRDRVRRTLRLFQEICRKLLQEEESKSKAPIRAPRVDLKAAEILKLKNEWVNTGEPILGPVPGVEIGDEFHYRTELAIIGLHHPFQGGIDKVKREDNTYVATSIVAGGTADEMDGSDVLIYSGSGGSPGVGNNPPEDQKLELGNLALKNSVEAKTPVRVIRGSKELKKDSDGKARPFSTFVYDGLYVVEKYWMEKFPQGFLGYKFQLRRNPGQPSRKSRKLGSLLEGKASV